MKLIEQLCAFSEVTNSFCDNVDGLEPTAMGVFQVRNNFFGSVLF